MENTQNNFHNETTFNNELKEKLKDLIVEKLPEFLEYCIVTKDFSPIKNMFELLNNNHF